MESPQDDGQVPKESLVNKQDHQEKKKNKSDMIQIKEEDDTKFRLGIT